jgi:small subunit ribosomal protein S16
VAVRLRLTRLGRKGQPFYRIVAVDSRKRRDGAYLEKIGHYNPNARPAELVMDDEKALKWLHVGAIPSDTVRSLLSHHGVMLAFDLGKRGLDAEEINARVAAHRQTVAGKLRAKDEAARPKPAPKPVEVVAAKPEAAAPVEVATAEPEVAAPVEAPPETPPENSPADSENTPTESTQS